MHTRSSPTSVTSVYDNPNVTTTAELIDLSVVVPAKDAAQHLGEQLDALCAQTCSRPWEMVVVVDEASSDGTAEVVQAYAARDPRVRLVLGAGGTPARARNIGIRTARGDAVAFCDADDVVAPGWVAAMRDALQHHVAVTGPLELDLLNPSWVADSRGRAFARERATFEGLFPYASSCNLGLRRSTIERVGGFDEQMHVGEDIDLSLRLWQAGLHLQFEPRALVHYRYRPRLLALYRQARSYGRVRPVILERARAAGHTVPGRFSGARNWLWLVRHVGQLRSRSGRARWLWVAGTRVGNLEASVNVRRLYV